MNYYEHHLGDYAAATAHLSWDEDMAYTRLIRAYYHHEKPIPADLKEACRFARAQSPAQRKAVETVLREFFVLLEDGWHQKRCDEEIDRYRESGTDRQLKAESERERQRRSRERRRQLFETLRGHGVIPKWDTPISELEAHLSRVTGRDCHAPVTNESREPVTPPVTPATGSQSPFPVPSPQSQAPDSGVELDISPHSESSHRLLSQSARAKPKRRETKTSGLNGHAEAFAQIQAAYPKRAGGQRWQDAAHAYHARLQEGRTHEEILAGVERYARHVRDKGDEGTQFVQQAATFLGTNRGFLEPWTSAPTKAEQRLGSNLSAAAEFMRRTEKPQ